MQDHTSLNQRSTQQINAPYVKSTKKHINIFTNTNIPYIDKNETKNFETLKKCRALSKFSPQILYSYLQHLHAAINNKTFIYKKPRQTQIGNLIDEAIKEQNRIGWLPALHGRLSIK